jgi:sugar lactone lactonase YvrE
MRCILFVAVVLLTAAGAQAAEKMAVVVAGDSLLTVPFGLDFLPDGTLVVADYGGHRVCKVTRDGKVSVLAGDGEKGHRDGKALTARFNGPHNVAVTAAGDVLVSDTLNHCVRRIDGKTGEVSTVAGSPEKGFAGDSGPARDARLDQAYHVCAMAKGFLVADLGNRRVRQVVDGTINTVAGNGKRGVPDDDSPAAAAPLVDPRAVARDVDGNVYVLERSGNALRVVDSQTGRIRTVAGTGKAGPASDGPAPKCTLRGPKYLWVEKNGGVLIADTDNHCIRRYSPTTGTLTTIAGTGKRGKGEAGEAPTATALDQPHGVAVDRDGTIYVSDSLNKRILKIER